MRIRRHISPSLPGWLRATADWSPTGRSQKDWGSGEHARCVEQHPQHGLCRIAGCVGHTSVHSDRGWPSCLGSGGCVVFHSSSNTQTSLNLCLVGLSGRCRQTESLETSRRTWNSDGEIIATRHFPSRRNVAPAPVEGGGAKVAWRSSSAEYRG